MNFEKRYICPEWVGSRPIEKNPENPPGYFSRFTPEDGENAEKNTAIDRPVIPRAVCDSCNASAVRVADTL